MSRILLPNRVWAALVVLLSLSLAGYFAYRVSFAPEALQRREIEKWVGIVGAAVELPEDEVPTVATVMNLEKLREQPFFVNAERGDKVLIYPRAGRAILYRPSTGKVIAMTTDVVIEKEEGL
jgi:hypothetical protein